MATVNERLRDEAIRHQIDTLRLRAGVLKRIVRLLQETDADLISQLKARLANLSAVDWERLKLSPVFSTRRLQELRKAVMKIEAAAREALTEALKGELAGVATGEAEHWKAYLDGVFKKGAVPLETTIPPIAQLEAAVLARPFQGAILRDHVKSWSLNKRKNIMAAIRLGIAEGEGIPSIARRMQKASDISMRGAETIARTAVNHVTQYARDQFAERNSAFIKDQQWVSTLDSRTSDLCFDATTKVTPIGEVLKCYKRLYNGDFSVIATAAGEELRATPNHPILTTRGWLPAHELKPRDHVVKVLLGHVDDGAEHGDVSVEAEVGAIADALFDPAVSTIFDRGSSEADFHGDGMGGGEKVSIAVIDGQLRDKLDLVSSENVKNALLAGVHLADRLDCLGLLFAHFIGWLPPVETAQVAPGALHGLVEPRLRPRLAELGINLRWARAGVEKLDGERAVADDGVVANAPWSGGHYTGPLEEGGDARRRGPVSAAETGRRGAVTILLDEVVSVRTETASRHVFNLETSSGLYIACGAIVKNCISRDGKLVKRDLKGATPPAHLNCRSVAVPVTKSYRELGLDIDEVPDLTRAAFNGKAAAAETYPAWFKRQSPEFQREVLGKWKFEEFQSGKFEITDFIDHSGKWLTRDEWIALNRKAAA